MSKLIKAYTHREPLIQNKKKVIEIKDLKSAFLQNTEKVGPLPEDAQPEQILIKAQSEAESIIRRAKTEAKQLQEQIFAEQQAFQQERERMEAQAYEDGFAKGIEEGRRNGEQEYKEAIWTAKEVIELAKKDYSLHVESAEKTILDIGLKVAGKILGKIILDENEQFLFIVKRAIKEVRDNLEVQLHVHPVHYDFLLSQKEELLIQFPRETKLYIYPDAELSKLSCIIESASGRIDAGIDSQLAEIKSKLFELLDGE